MDAAVIVRVDDGLEQFKSGPRTQRRWSSHATEMLLEEVGYITTSLCVLVVTLLIFINGGCNFEVFSTPSNVISYLRGTMIVDFYEIEKSLCFVWPSLTRTFNGIREG